MVAVVAGLGFAAYLRRHRPQIYDGLNTDLERFEPAATALPASKPEARKGHKAEPEGVANAS